MKAYGQLMGGPPLFLSAHIYFACNYIHCPSFRRYILSRSSARDLKKIFGASSLLYLRLRALPVTMPSKLPWDIVKAESLRSICTDLGRRLSTRAEMVDFLGKVEDEGRTSNHDGCL
jgi:hypothetical protein